MKIAWVDTLVNFFKDVRAEMKKVSWPTSQEVWGTTLVTMVATMALAIYLYFADFVLGRLMQYVYLKLGA